MIWATQPRSEFGELAVIRSGAGQSAGVLLLHGVMMPITHTAQVNTALIDFFSECGR